MDTDSDSGSEDQYEIAKELEQDAHAQVRPGINEDDELENEIERMLGHNETKKME